MEVVRELSGAIQGARRTPLSRGSSWSAAELDPQVASPGLSRHRLSGRECILAETLHQRGNRAVTNKQFARWSRACSQLGTHANAGIEQTIQTTSSCRARQWSDRYGRISPSHGVSHSQCRAQRPRRGGDVALQSGLSRIVYRQSISAASCSVDDVPALPCLELSLAGVSNSLRSSHERTDAVTINGTVASVLRSARMVRLLNGDTVHDLRPGKCQNAAVEHLIRLGY